MARKMPDEEEPNSNQIALEIVQERHFSSSTSESDDYSQWCVKNIFIKECTCFVPAKEGSVQKCGCGLLRSQHKDVHSDTSVEWSSSKHTRSIPTNAFGKVSFSEEQQDELLAAKYIRLSDSTSMDRLWYLIKNHWKLKPPTLIISIIGGNSDVKVNMDVKRALEDGLTEVINQTDVWLLTGATGTSVTNLAAKVFKDNYKPERWTKNACIGIAPWGSIPENEQLVGEMVDVIYAPASNMLLERQKLNADHTHFLLVDDGTRKQYGTERAFKVNLERYLCDPLDSRSIPSVNLLVHGGYHACMQIKENFNGHPNIPTVVVKGSGGLADILANAHKAYTKGRRGPPFLDWITNELSNSSYFKDHAKIPQLQGAITEILEKHSSELNIYDPKADPHGLDHAIMEACISCYAEKMDIYDRLQLTMCLDNIDAARSDIEQHGANEEMLYKFIKKGRATFVEILLNHSVDLEKFLGKNKVWLTKLYKNRIKDEAMLTILPKDSKEFQLKDVDDLLDSLLDGDYTRYYDREEDPDNEIDKVVMTPAQQLIIWAVLTDMSDVVEVFWKFDTEKALENALIIFRLYKAMSESSKFDEIRTADLMSTARKYEALSVELLSLMYKQNARVSVDVVQSRIALWGYKNLVTLAVNGTSHEFVAHICCQTYLYNVWLGKAEKRTLKSEVWKIKEKLQHPSRHASNSQYHEMKSKKGDRKPGQDETENKDGEDCQDHEDGPVPSRRQKFGARVAAIFRFLFLVPKGKLFVHEFIFAIFLGCFAYFVLVKKGLYHDSLRYVVFTMVTALTIDEIREISEVRKRTLYLKLKEWQGGWNMLDCTAILLFYTGFTLGSYGFAYTERTIMAVDLMLWVFKFAQFYRAFQTLGPYLLMIYKMMFHMIGFVFVLLIAVVAYGIFMHTLLFPEVSVSWELIFKLLFRPYLLVFGELGINSYTLSSTTTVYGTKKVSEATEITVVIGMCIYLLVANVLLLNMLIAVFNNIYEDIKNNSDKIWRFDKYGMIMEYRNKPILPIPLSVLSNVPRICRHICRDERRRLYCPEKNSRILMDFQNRCATAFFREYTNKASMEEKHDLVIKRWKLNPSSYHNCSERLQLNSKVFPSVPFYNYSTAGRHRREGTGRTILTIYHTVTHVLYCILL